MKFFQCLILMNFLGRVCAESVEGGTPAARLEPLLGRGNAVALPEVDWVSASSGSGRKEGGRRRLGAQKGVYAERESGGCTDGYLTTKAACEEGAGAVGWDKVTEVTAETDSRSYLPRGCVLSGGRYLYFNTYTSSTTSCSSDYKCVCALLCQPGTYQDQTGQTSCKTCPTNTYSVAEASSCDYNATSCPAGTRASGTATVCENTAQVVMYAERTSGGCTDGGAGWGYVTTKAACEVGAGVVGSSDVGATTRSWSDRPRGCYLANSGTLLVFNTDTSSTASCNEYYQKCICTLLCQPGTYQDQPGQTSCKTCSAGTYQDQAEQNYCKTCLAGTYQDQAEKSNCKSCGTGKYNDQTERTAEADCKTCSAGKYQDQAEQNNCKTCPTNTYSIVEASSCDYNATSCPAGTYASGTAACDACGLGKYNNQTGEAECKDCGTGKYNDQTGSTTESNCTDCGGGKFNNQTGQSNCTECGTGKYNDQMQRTDCKDCGIGKYNGQTGRGSETVCKLCERGKYNNQTGQNNCTDCTAGKYNDQTGQSNCTDCGTGKYNGQTGSTTESNCTDCGYGKFNDQTGQNNCTDCTAGKYNDQTGSTTESNCTDCGGGKFNNQTGQSNCTECGTGKYNDQTGSTDCKDCGIGKYNGQTGRGSETVCKVCGLGKYNNQTGQADCKVCGLGKYIARWLKQWGADCTNCPAGQYNGQTGAVRDGYCTDCLVGLYADDEGSALCKECPIGYSSGLIRIVSHNNRNIVSYVLNTTECQACAIGKYQNNTKKSKCKDCPDGYYENRTASSSCQECPGGRQQDNSKSECEDCKAGKFRVADFQDNFTECQYCPRGMYENRTKSVLCKFCVAGTFANDSKRGTECDLCGAGFYGDEEGQSRCKECNYLEYQDEVGQTTSSCKKCQAGKYQKYQPKIWSCPDKFPFSVSVDESASNIQNTECWMHKLCTDGLRSKKNWEPFCAEWNDFKTTIMCVWYPGTIPFCNGEEYGYRRINKYLLSYSQSSQCVECDSGQYQNEVGKGACVHCPAGYQSSSQSKAQCVKCPHGTYTDKTGQDTCLRCPWRGECQHLTTIHPKTRISVTGKWSDRKAHIGTRFTLEKIITESSPSQSNHKLYDRANLISMNDTFDPIFRAHMNESSLESERRDIYWSSGNDSVSPTSHISSRNIFFKMTECPLENKIYDEKTCYFGGGTPGYAIVEMNFHNSYNRLFYKCEQFANDPITESGPLKIHTDNASNLVAACNAGRQDQREQCSGGNDLNNTACSWGQKLSGKKPLEHPETRTSIMYKCYDGHDEVCRKKQFYKSANYHRSENICSTSSVMSKDNCEEAAKELGLIFDSKNQTTDEPLLNGCIMHHNGHVTHSTENSSQKNFCTFNTGKECICPNELNQCNKTTGLPMADNDDYGTYYMSDTVCNTTDSLNDRWECKVAADWFNVLNTTTVLEELNVTPLKPSGCFREGDNFYWNTQNEYYVKENGTCPDDVVDANECEHLSKTFKTMVATNKVVNNKTSLVYDGNETGCSDGWSSDQACIDKCMSEPHCQGLNANKNGTCCFIKSFVPTMAVYEKLTTGTCTSWTRDGLGTIAECKAAADQLNLIVDSVSMNVESRKPTGCYLDKLSGGGRGSYKLWYNKPLSNECSTRDDCHWTDAARSGYICQCQCSESSICLCKAKTHNVPVEQGWIWYEKESIAKTNYEYMISLPLYPDSSCSTGWDSAQACVTKCMSEPECNGLWTDESHWTDTGISSATWTSTNKCCFQKSYVRSYHNFFGNNKDRGIWYEKTKMRFVSPYMNVVNCELRMPTGCDRDLRETLYINDSISDLHPWFPTACRNPVMDNLTLHQVDAWYKMYTFYNRSLGMHIPASYAVQWREQGLLDGYNTFCNRTDAEYRDQPSDENLPQGCSFGTHFNFKSASGNQCSRENKCICKNTHTADTAVTFVCKRNELPKGCSTYNNKAYWSDESNENHDSKYKVVNIIPETSFNASINASIR